MQSFFSRKAKAAKNKVGRKSMKSLVCGFFPHPLVHRGRGINPLTVETLSCLQVWRQTADNTKLRDLKPHRLKRTTEHHTAKAPITFFSVILLDDEALNATCGYSEKQKQTTGRPQQSLELE